MRLLILQHLLFSPCLRLFYAHSALVPAVIPYTVCFLYTRPWYSLVLLYSLLLSWCRSWKKHASPPYKTLVGLGCLRVQKLTVINPLTFQWISQYIVLPAALLSLSITWTPKGYSYHNRHFFWKKKDIWETVKQHQESDSQRFADQILNRIRSMLPKKA